MNFLNNTISSSEEKMKLKYKEEAYGKRSCDMTKTNFWVYVATYSIHWQAQQGCSNSSCSTSKEPLKICGFLIPRPFQQLVSVCIICIEIDWFKWSSAKNINKVPLPKAFQSFSCLNCLDELEKAPLFTTNYILKLQSLQRCYKSSVSTSTKFRAMEEKSSITTK